MANEKPQNFKNHTRFVPMFHIFTLWILGLNAGNAIYRLIKFGVSYRTVFELLLALALIMAALFSRIFAITVQDRVIRLEMRLRLGELLPPDLRPRIPEFTVSQLVALRFAGDAELPALARRVLDEKITKRKDIKILIKDWQADNLRA